MLDFLLPLIAGIILGSICFWGVLAKRRSEIVGLQEKVGSIEQEKLIVVDFMHNMVEALGENLSNEELYQRIAHAAILSSGALSACVFEKTENDTMRGVAVEGLFPPHRPLPEHARVKLTTRSKFIEEVLKSEEFPVGDGIVGGVAKTLQGELIEYGQLDSRVVKHDDASLVVKTSICVPILFRGNLIGVLAVCNSSSGKPFTQTDFSLVQSIAEQAGMAIHHNEFLSLQVEKKRLDVDLSMASDIQRMLLPSELPLVKGLDMAARYTSAQEVGGDLYDVMPLSEGKVGIVVADVSGKGIPASLVMAICRSNLRLYARTCESPSQALKQVNAAMAGDMRDGMYITVLYAIIDTNAETITYSRAGHERPILCRMDDALGVPVTDSLDSEGMPVGLAEPELFDELIEEKSVPFRKGDVFVAYTDGITETANEDGKEFSSSRLADVIKTLRKRDAESMSEGVLESLERFAGKGVQADDLTLIALKRI